MSGSGSSRTPQGGITTTLPKSFNRIVCDRLDTWVAEAASDASLREGVFHVHSEQVHEWDGAHYMLERGPQGSITIALSMLQASGTTKAYEALALAYKGVAKVVDPPCGYAICLDVNVRMLTRMDAHQRDFWIKELASLRLNIMGAPLRAHFERLVRGECSPKPIEEHCTRPGQLYFIKQQQGAVTIVFPVRFSSAFDASIGKAFLEEFTIAREMPVLGRSPECSYSLQAPQELSQVDPARLSDVNGGYMSFTLIRRHVHGPQASHVVWSMCSFYFLISCHLKACKAAIHAKMRHSMAEMCGRLIVHRPPWEEAAETQTAV